MKPKREGSPDAQAIRDLKKKDPRSLTRGEKKILRQSEIRQADQKYRETEIKFGLRTKILTLVILLLTGTVFATYSISVNSQTESLEQQLIEKGEIITTALNNAIKAKINDENLPLFDNFNDKKYKQITSAEDFRKFYSRLNLNGAVFEFVQNQRDIPDLVYVVVTGMNGIIWNDVHTKKHLLTRKRVIGLPYYEAYSDFNGAMQPGVNSYFSEYQKRGLAKPEPIIQEFVSREFNTAEKDLPGDWKNELVKKPGEQENILDISVIVALSSGENIKIQDALGEIHVGISKTRAEEAIADTTFNLSMAAFFAFVISFTISVAAATFLARPIMAMTSGMQKVSEGDFSAAVRLNSKDEIGRLSGVFNRMLGGLSILVSPEVAKVVLNTEDLYTASEQREVTVLFSDIRGFTTISEELTPKEVVHMLNDYLDLMTNIIVKYQGVVDKFVGDEIFAAFGAPFDHPNHPLAACAVAVEMGAVLAAHNEERRQLKKKPINIGIGLNTGAVIAGAMGSKKRVDYTSIGDTVNLGARLEGTNKVYGTLAIMSEFTLARVREWVIYRELDSIKVKGKNQPVLIYEVVDLTDEGWTLAKQFIVEPRKS